MPTKKAPVLKTYKVLTPIHHRPVRSGVRSRTAVYFMAGEQLQTEETFTENDPLFHVLKPIKVSKEEPAEAQEEQPSEEG